MNRLLFIVLLFGFLHSRAQSGDVVATMKQFHQLMVKNDASLGNYIHDSLSYGHSTGWVQNAWEFKNDMGSTIVYHSIKEDSVVAVTSGKLAYIRFVGDFDVTFRNVHVQSHLKVLEVWMKQKDRWILFVRQGVK